MTDLLPSVPDEATYAPLRRRPEVWLPAMRAICARHDLDAGVLERAATGTHVVFLAGDVVIKMFVECWATDVLRERAALTHLDGWCGAPRVVAEGELEGWPYLVLTRLGGVPIDAVWSDLDRAAQTRLAGRLGERLAELHRSPTAGLEDVLVPAGGHPTWAAFVAAQRAGVRAHHAWGDPGERWLDEVEAFVADLPDDLTQADEAPKVLLHADVTNDHVRVAEGPDGWDVVGLFDYGDAVLGHPRYELAAPVAFLTPRRPWATRALLDSYGYGPDDLTADDLLAAVLLHRYGRLKHMLDLVPGERPRGLADLRAAYAPD